MKRIFTIFLGGCIGLLLTFQVMAQKPSCSGNSFSSEVIKKVKISESCTQYEIKVSYDGTRSFGLSHYSIGIPCGTVKNVWNSENWKEVFGKDPTTGVYGLKIDDISGFGERRADSFTVKFTWCADNSCNKELGKVAYKAGQCIDYETVKDQSPQPPTDIEDDKPICKEHNRPSCNEDHKPVCKEHDKPGCTENHKPTCNEQHDKPSCSKDHKHTCKEHNKPSCTENHKPTCKEHNKPGCTEGHKPVCKEHNKPGCKEDHRPVCKEHNKPGCKEDHRPVCKEHNKPGCKEDHRPVCKEHNKPGCKEDHRPVCKEHNKPGCNEDHNPPCVENTFSSEIVSKKQISATCVEYQIKVSYDGTKSYGLSHYSIGIPCGEVKNVSNSENWKQVIGKDPTTGVKGIKIDDISKFGERGADSFLVKFKWCADNSCNKELGVVAYKAGKCIDYDTLGHPLPPTNPNPPQDTVTVPQPPQQPTCEGNSFSSEVVKGVQVSETCVEYEIKVSYDGTKTFGLSHYTIGIPCGEVKNISNSETWKNVFGKDPTTGVYGLKVDDISGFGEKGADTFTVKFTWCSDGSCNKELGVVSYKAGQCVDYDTLDHQLPEPPQPPQDTIPDPPQPPQDTVTVPQPPQDTVTCSSLLASLQKKNATCATGNNGEMEVTIQEGIEPIVYSWSNGATTSKVLNLTPGTYSVTVTDAKGNTLTLSESITSSPPIVISETITNPYCSGAASGVIELNVTGGSGGYTFIWSNGSTQQNVMNLSSGLHTVTVTDSEGCSAQKTFMLTNSTLISATSVLKHTTCNQVTGGVDITPSGGIAPYTFLWSNGATTEDIQNVPAGTYSVTIKDAAGCSTKKNYTLRVNTTLTLSGVVKPSSCLGDNSGAIDLSVFGGTPPYNIVWADGATSEDRTGLVEGQYPVTVTDATGCSVQANYTIFKKPLQVNSDLIQPKCNEDRGSITLTVEGVPPYTYNWSNGETDESITDLPPGFYSVTVTDASGCTRTLDFAILAPPPIVVTSAITNPLCGVEGSYAINLTVSGGKPSYTFLWSNGATTQNVTGLNSGSYSVAITDAGGCVVNKQFTVDAVTAGWSCLIDQPTAAIVCGSAGNLLSTSVTDGTSYQWTASSTDNSWSITSGANSATAVYTAGAAGSTATFTLTITKNGCSQTCTYTANSCTVKDNTGGGDPTSTEPCVTTSLPVNQVAFLAPADEPVQNSEESARVSGEEITFNLDVYPNPFNDKLNFEWTATANDFVRIEILDQFGNRMTILYEGSVSKGQHYTFDWTASGLRDRIYYYRFTSSSNSEYGKLLRQ